MDDTQMEGSGIRESQRDYRQAVSDWNMLTTTPQATQQELAEAWNRLHWTDRALQLSYQGYTPEALRELSKPLEDIIVRTQAPIPDKRASDPIETEVDKTARIAAEAKRQQEMADEQALQFSEDMRLRELELQRGQGYKKRRRRSRMGPYKRLKRDRNYTEPKQWTEDQLEILRANFPEMTDEHLALLRGGDLWGDTRAWFEEAGRKIKEGFENAFDPKKNGLEKLINDAIAEIGPSLDAVAQKLKRDLDPATNGVDAAFKTFGNNVTGAFNDLGEKIRAQAAKDKAALDAAFGPVGEAFKNLGDASWWRDTMSNPETYFMLASVLISAAGSFLGPGGVLLANAVVGAARMVTKAARGEQVNLSDALDLAVGLIPGGGGAKAATSTVKAAQTSVLSRVATAMRGVSTNPATRRQTLGKNLVELVKAGEGMGIVPPLARAKQITPVPTPPETAEDREKKRRFDEEERYWNENKSNWDKWATTDMWKQKGMVKLVLVDIAGERNHSYYVIKPRNPGPPPTTSTADATPRIFVGPKVTIPAKDGQPEKIEDGKNMQVYNATYKYRVGDVVIKTFDNKWVDIDKDPAVKYFVCKKIARGVPTFDTEFWEQIDKEEAIKTEVPEPYTDTDDYIEKVELYKAALEEWNKLPDNWDKEVVKDRPLFINWEYKYTDVVESSWNPLKSADVWVEEYGGRVNNDRFRAAKTIKDMNTLLAPFIEEYKAISKDKVEGALPPNWTNEKSFDYIVDSIKTGRKFKTYKDVPISQIAAISFRVSKTDQNGNPWNYSRIITSKSEVDRLRSQGVNVITDAYGRSVEEVKRPTFGDFFKAFQDDRKIGQKIMEVFMNAINPFEEAINVDSLSETTKQALDTRLAEINASNDALLADKPDNWVDQESRGETITWEDSIEGQRKAQIEQAKREAVQGEQGGNDSNSFNDRIAALKEILETNNIENSELLSQEIGKRLLSQEAIKKEVDELKALYFPEDPEVAAVRDKKAAKTAEMETLENDRVVALEEMADYATLFQEKLDSLPLDPETFENVMANWALDPSTGMSSLYKLFVDGGSPESFEINKNNDELLKDLPQGWDAEMVEGNRQALLTQLENATNTEWTLDTIMKIMEDSEIGLKNRQQIEDSRALGFDMVRWQAELALQMLKVLNVTRNFKPNPDEPEEVLFKEKMTKLDEKLIKKLDFQEILEATKKTRSDTKEKALKKVKLKNDGKLFFESNAAKNLFVDYAKVLPSDVNSKTVPQMIAILKESPLYKANKEVIDFNQAEHGIEYIGQQAVLAIEAREKNLETLRKQALEQSLAATRRLEEEAKKAEEDARAREEARLKALQEQIDKENEDIAIPSYTEPVAPLINPIYTANESPEEKLLREYQEALILQEAGEEYDPGAFTRYQDAQVWLLDNLYGYGYKKKPKRYNSVKKGRKINC